MTLKVKELQNVIIEESVEEGWDKWGKTFTDYFVGNTENALQCKIKNGNDIKFRYYKKSNRLIAYSEKPVVIENKALGYNIRYQLEDFDINFKEQSFLFLGYPLFEDMNGSRKSLRPKWKNNREVAYNGSIFHFMKCIYDNTLLPNGFEVRRAVRIPNAEKQRVKSIQAATFKTQRIAGASITIGNPFEGLSPDTIAYYKEVLKQNDYKEIIGKSLLTADSLVFKKEGDYKAITFTDFLYIIYKNELEEEGYSRKAYPPRKPGMQQTYVNLSGEMYLVIDKTGNYFNPRFFYSSGYWGWSEKMANMLPVDYNMKYYE